MMARRHNPLIPARRRSPRLHEAGSGITGGGPGSTYSAADRLSASGSRVIFRLALHRTSTVAGSLWQGDQTYSSLSMPLLNETPIL